MFHLPSVKVLITAFVVITSFVSSAHGYQVTKPPRPWDSASGSKTGPTAFVAEPWKQVRIAAAHAFATAALSTVLLTNPPSAHAASTETAAQIQLNSLPPSSVTIDIRDLPVIGRLVSGTYSRVPEASNAAKIPSVVIKSPQDKVKAIQQAATTGHLEFDVSGIISTHLDIDVAADQKGVAMIRVASDLIPKLPFKNAASPSTGSPTGGKESPWNMVTNLGSGETYYYNEKTGVTQYDKPNKY